MATTLTKHERNLSAIIHASTFSKYFIPFGNFILPLILWTANKKEYEFVDYNGKQALNFQISMFFLSFWPDVFDWDVFGFNRLHNLNNFDIHISNDDFKLRNLLWPAGSSGLLQASLVIVNVVYSILATIRTNEGQVFKYPLTIKFIK